MCICVHLWLKFLAFSSQDAGRARSLARHRPRGFRRHATDLATSAFEIQPRRGLRRAGSQGVRAPRPPPRPGRLPVMRVFTEPAPGVRIEILRQGFDGGKARPRLCHAAMAVLVLACFAVVAQRLYRRIVQTPLRMTGDNYGMAAASSFVTTGTRARPNSPIVCLAGPELLEKILINLLDMKCILYPAADVVADH